MRGGSGLEARVDAARLVELLLLANKDAKAAASAESPELVAKLVRLIGPVDEKGTLDRHAVEAGLSCLAAIEASPRSAARWCVAAPSDKALRVLEHAVGCAEGRAALCERVEEAIPTVLNKMMKAGRHGAEAAVAVLWAVCHRYRDRRAAEAAAAAEGGLTKLLLLMQSGCSPAARQMAMELLKVYKVNAKSYLDGYNTRTTHIMTSEAME